MAERKNCFKKFNIRARGLVLLLFITSATVDAFGQNDKNKKEVINITSSFKPSIVKSGKIEFSATPLGKDVSPYDFVYPVAKNQFSTPMRSFMVRPLSYKSDKLDKDTANLYAKLGYGNLNTPFVSLGLNHEFSKSTISLIADHISSKGKLPDQELQNTSVAAKLNHTISENQSLEIQTGYDRDAYRLYGFDHSMFTFNSSELRQHFSNIFFGAGYRLTAGPDNQAIVAPSVRADILSASRNVEEQLITINSPFTYTINNTWRIYAQPSAEIVQLKSSQGIKYSNNLISLPVLAHYSSKQLQVKAGVVPVSQSGGVKVAPEFLISYAIGQSGVSVKGGVSNKFNVNSYHSLYGFNPFTLSPDTLTTSHNSDYFVGFDWTNTKGLQVRFKTGVIQYRNQPLFYNSSGDGKNLLSILDQSFTALNVEAAIDYSFSRMFSVNASVQALSFADFEGLMKAYGLLPMTLSGGVSWKPLKGLHIRGRAYLWQGAMAKDVSMNDIRLKGAVDISFGVEYSLNKKWALWTDLNNIANSTYQRWNQYPSFGFHAIGGVRFTFHK